MIAKKWRYQIFWENSSFLSIDVKRLKVTPSLPPSQHCSLFEMNQSEGYNGLLISCAIPNIWWSSHAQVRAQNALSQSNR